MKRILLVIFATIALVGCEKFLDTQSYTSSNTTNFPSNEEEAIKLVTGVYASLNDGIEDIRSTYIFLAELASDDCFGGGGPDDPDWQALDHLLYVDPEQFSPFWNACYAGIGRANMALSTLDNVSDEKVRTQLMGECYILRANYYFWLAQMFGKLPLITEVPQNVEEAAQYPSQSNDDDVYAFIAGSLKEAIETMPSGAYNTVAAGHVTKWDAEALLARVYLFYTGFYGKSSLPCTDMATGEKTEDITKDYVVRALEDCRDHSGHHLLADFRSLWPYTNKYTLKGYEAKIAAGITGLDWIKGASEWAEDNNNPEQMFHIACAPFVDQYNQYGIFFAPRKCAKSGYIPSLDKNVSNVEDYFSLGCTYPLGRGWGAGPVNPALWDEWEAAEPNDIRRQASILNGPIEGEIDYIYGNEEQMEESGLWRKKLVSIRANQDGDYYGGTYLWSFYDDAAFGGPGKKGSKSESQGYDVTLIRFADVLLMHSELTQTADGMNQVRARAGLAPVGYSLKALQEERRHEFAFEGLRWGDIRRWGDDYAIAALTSQLGQKIWCQGTATEFNDQSSAGLAGRYKATRGFMPLPKSEVELADGALVQTEGWDYSESQHYNGWKFK